MADLVCEIMNWSGPDDVVWVTFTGRIHMDTAPAFRRQLEKLVGTQPRALAVELADVSYMDSSGVAVLVECLRWSHAAGIDFVLLAPSTRVLEAFEVVGLGGIFVVLHRPQDLHARAAHAVAKRGSSSTSSAKRSQRRSARQPQVSHDEPPAPQPAP